ncbi:MAG: hypothetical protein AAF967_11925, partial [Pseudomonadota bacterium]
MKLWIGGIAAATIATVLMIVIATANESRMYVPARPDPDSPRCVSGSVYGYTLELCNGSYSVSGQNMT